MLQKVQGKNNDVAFAGSSSGCRVIQNRIDFCFNLNKLPNLFGVKNNSHMLHYDLHYGL